MIPMKEALIAGDHHRAHELLEDADFLVQNSKNQLLYRLEKASIYHYQNQFKDAERAYKHAAQLATELYTKSMTQGAMSFVINENTKDYAGEDYEIIAIHTMMAILYLEMGELNKAVVEARRINTRLRELARDTQTRGDGNDLATHIYERDAFALYLSGLIFEAVGRADDAIVDYKNALESYEQGYPGGAVPAGLVKSLYRLARHRRRQPIVSALVKQYSHELKGMNTAPGGGLVVIAKGLPAVGKHSETFVFQAADQLIRYSWPVIPQYSPAMPDYSLRLTPSRTQLSSLSDQPVESSHPLEVAQNYNELARAMLEQKRAVLTVKAISRIVAKSAIAHQLMEAESPAVVLMGALLSLSSLFTESADTRSWNLLPGQLGVQRYFLQGGQSYTLSYRSPQGTNSRYSFVQDRRLRFLVLDYSQNSLALSTRLSR